MDTAEKMRALVLEGNATRNSVKYDEGTIDLGKVDLGYFGTIDIISIGGKKTIVQCDPRDGILKPLLVGWYDDIRWTPGESWNPDTRFLSDPNSYPAIVKKDGKWSMIGYYGQKEPETGRWRPFYEEWYDDINPRCRAMQCGDSWVTVYDAVKDGERCMLTKKGRQITIDMDVTMRQVKDWTKEDIVHKWIEADRPCSFIYGFAYKGAKAHPIGKEEALRRIKTHSFGKGFYSMDWVVFDGQVTLQFSEYSESDML